MQKVTNAFFLPLYKINLFLVQIKIFEELQCCVKSLRGFVTKGWTGNLFIKRSLKFMYCLDQKCSDGWTPFGVKCYKYFTESFNWITAEVMCCNFMFL